MELGRGCEDARRTEGLKGSKKNSRDTAAETEKPGEQGAAAAAAATAAATAAAAAATAPSAAAATPSAATASSAAAASSCTAAAPSTSGAAAPPTAATGGGAAAATGAAAKQIASFAEDLRDLSWGRLSRTSSFTATCVSLKEKSFYRIQKALNRLKHLNERDSRDNLLKELQGVNLSLFLAEAAAALAELNCKAAALRSAADAVVYLSDVYPEFPALFVSALSNSIKVC